MTSGTTTLPAILRAIGREVADLEQQALGLQVDLSPLVQCLGKDQATIERLQTLDLIAQRLHGLGCFLGALGPTLSENWQADAVAAARIVVLSDLQRRLSCVAPDSPSAEDGDTGAFELFGDGDG